VQLAVAERLLGLDAAAADGLICRAVSI
jgi:hypothetical protein